MITLHFCEMLNIFVTCQMLVGQPWCLCFYWLLLLPLCFSTCCSLSESDCGSEPAQTLAPEMSFLFLKIYLTKNHCNNMIHYSNCNLPASVFGWDQQWLCLQPGQLWVFPVPVLCLVWLMELRLESCHSQCSLLRSSGWYAPGTSHQSAPEKILLL